MDGEVNFSNIPCKDQILNRIEQAKVDGTGFGHRFSADDILKLFRKSDTDENRKEILRTCRFAFGDNFDLVMPVVFASLDFPMKKELYTKIIIEMVWSRIDQLRKNGALVELTNKEIYAEFGFIDGKNVPVELMLFSNDIDTMNPAEKFVRHTSTGDVLYSTSEFNAVYKFFTYSGLSHKTVAMAWDKVKEAKRGNLVRFEKHEISYMEAADLFNHRTKTFEDTENAYSIEQYFNILPAAYVKETSPDFDLDSSSKLFLKLIYSGECCVKYTPFIVRCDKDIFKQNVKVHGARAIEESIKYISKGNESALNEINIIKGLMVRAGVSDLDIVPATSADDGKEMLAIKPKLFNDVEFLKTLFSASGLDEKNENIVIAIMRHSKEFRSDKSAVACAIGATSKAYNLASEHILPDKIIVLSIIKKYEEEIRADRQVEISKKLLAFSDTIACDEDCKLIIKALDEFTKIDSDAETKNAMLSKIDQILQGKRAD